MGIILNMLIVYQNFVENLWELERLNVCALFFISCSLCVDSEDGFEFLLSSAICFYVFLAKSKSKQTHLVFLIE